MQSYWQHDGIIKATSCRYISLNGSYHTVDTFLFTPRVEKKEKSLFGEGVDWGYYLLCGGGRFCFLLGTWSGEGKDSVKVEKVFLHAFVALLVQA